MAKKIIVDTKIVRVDENDLNDIHKKYSKLLGTVDYDHDAAEELAAALNEIEELTQRTNALKSLVNENKELHDFIWRTNENISLALHQIEDAHLVNIMMHLIRNGRAISKAIRSEAIRRGIVVPQHVPVDWEDDDRMMEISDRSDTFGVRF
jgi:hypothetical protein